MHSSNSGSTSSNSDKSHVSSSNVQPRAPAVSSIKGKLHVRISGNKKRKSSSQTDSNPTSPGIILDSCGVGGMLSQNDYRDPVFLRAEQFAADELLHRHEHNLQSLDDSYKSSIKEAFNCFDIDHDGRITSAELCKVFQFLDITVTEEQVRLMIEHADEDGNGTIEFSEFFKMMQNYNECRLEQEDGENLKNAFRAFDHNGDQFIDFDEIKKTMHFLGETVSDDDVREMIKQADIDNDGKINFDEFKQLMSIMQRRSHDVLYR